MKALLNRIVVDDTFVAPALVASTLRKTSTRFTFTLQEPTLAPGFHSVFDALVLDTILSLTLAILSTCCTFLLFETFLGRFRSTEHTPGNLSNLLTNLRLTVIIRSALAALTPSETFGRRSVTPEDTLLNSLSIFANTSYALNSLSTRSAFWKLRNCWNG